MCWRFVNHCKRRSVVCRSIFFFCSVGTNAHDRDKRHCGQWYPRVRKFAAPRRKGFSDCWPRDTLNFWNGTPETEQPTGLRAESADEVAEVLSYAMEQKKTVVPYGAEGSGRCGQSGAVVIDTKRLNTIGPLNEIREQSASSRC